MLCHFPLFLQQAGPPTLEAAAKAFTLVQGLTEEQAYVGVSLFQTHRKPGRSGIIILQMRKLKTKQETRRFQSLSQGPTAELGVQSKLIPDSPCAPGGCKPPRELTWKVLTGLGCRCIISFHLPSSGFNLQSDGARGPRKLPELSTIVVYSSM